MIQGRSFDYEIPRRTSFGMTKIPPVISTRENGRYNQANC